MTAIEELEQRYAAAEQTYRDAGKARLSAASELAQARAKDDGLKVGQLVEYKTGKKTFRGRIERIGRSRYEFAWDRGYSIHIRIVRKDGSMGDRRIELGQRDFASKYPEDITARVIEQPTGTGQP